MDRESIGTLIQAAVDGDAAAWKALVEGLSPLVWSVIRAHRLSEYDGQEVYQTTWFRFAQHLARIREPAKAGSWLASTARHECLKVIKAASRLTPVDDRELLDLPSEDRTPEQVAVDSVEEAAEADRVRQLWEAFQGLSENCRRLLRVLMASPPPSYQEVSAALGIAIGSIGPTRQRCLRHLRASLAERGIQ